MHRATKLHYLELYKFTVPQELHEADNVERVQFCGWFCGAVCSDEVYQLLVCLSDEEWFHFRVHVITENSRYWSSENPRLIYDMPLRDVKVGVWCTISATRNYWTSFFFQRQ